MNDLKIFQIKSDIAEYIANQRLPVSLAIYIIKDILKELEDLYPQVIQKQMELYSKQQKLEEEPETISAEELGLDPNMSISVVKPLLDLKN